MKDDQEVPSEEGYEQQIEIKVDPKQSPIRIDKFILSRLEKVSRNKIQIGLKTGAILVNGKSVKPNYKVRPNDDISIVFPKSYDGSEVKAEEMDLDIRYEDDDIIILHKPPGLVVHPGVGNYTGTLVNGLAHYFKNMPVMEGNPPDRPGLVHRIDKNTSGLLVIAKNDYAMTHLARQFFDHSIDREYVALVWGEPDDEKGTIEVNIGRHQKNRTENAPYPDGDFGKEAITHYEMIEPLYYVSLVKCKLETGRTHQIRVHMKYAGHPLFNDEKYGGDKIVKGTVFSKYKQFVHNCFKLMPRQALHARSLGFIHPRTEEPVYFESELPEDFQLTLEKWRSYVDARKETK